MPDPILILRLEGPLQSWGSRSRWSRRDSVPEPTKSGIIGLLGCATGILRPDWRSAEVPERTLENWDMTLRFGVRVDCPGAIETDYHTVQGRHWQANGKMKTASSASGTIPDKALYEPPHTEISWRDYIHDAAFLVVLASREHGLLETLEDALKAPKWPIYLGRKSCVPSRPVLDQLTHQYDDIEQALRSHPRHPRAQDGYLAAYVEDAEGDLERQDAMRLNPLRMYDFRRCRYLTEVNPPCTSPASH